MAPLLDCHNQLPLWAFCTGIAVLFTLLGVCWRVADVMQKKKKRQKRQERKEKEEATNASAAGDERGTVFT